MKTLVKIKYIEDTSGLTSYIEAFYTDTPTELLRLVKEVGDITIEDETYKFVFSDFRPALTDEFLNLLVLYVDYKYID